MQKRAKNAAAFLLFIVAVCLELYALYLVHTM